MSPLPLLMLLAAVPDDPDAALGQLASYGPVPECHLEEQIEKADFDHRHVFSRPKILPALEGRAEQLLPFLEHPSRRVVLRAIELLCHVDGEAALPRVRALAMKFPCERELATSAAVMTGDRSLMPGPGCPYELPPVMLAPARTIAGWTADAALAKAITSGDAPGLERTLWNLEALEPARAQQAVATLGKVNSAGGALATIRALFRRLGKDGWRQVDPLMRGVLGAQLDALSPSRAAAWCLVIGRAGPEDFPLLQQLENPGSQSDRSDLEKAADKARRTGDLTRFGRAYLEKLSNGQHDWVATREKLRRFVDHRDRPALRAFLKDEGNGIADRMDAAKELALLGDASGLSLWSTPEGLWTDERVVRKELLLRIAHDAPPEVREKAEALLREW